MPSAWVEALREWNAKHNTGTWCVPRKGSKELEEARAIMARIKKEKGGKVEAPKAAKAEPKGPKTKMATPEQTQALAAAVRKAKATKTAPLAAAAAEAGKERVVEKVKATGKKVKVKEFLRKALEKAKAKKAAAAKPKSAEELLAPKRKHYEASGFKVGKKNATRKPIQYFLDNPKVIRDGDISSRQLDNMRSKQMVSANFWINPLTAKLEFDPNTPIIVRITLDEGGTEDVEVAPKDLDEMLDELENSYEIL